MNHTLDSTAVQNSSFAQLGSKLWESTKQLLTKFASYLFTASLILALYYTWANRHDPAWIPEDGLGYYLGIIGGTMMLLLLLYPMRKNMKAMSKMLPIRYWFQTHMILGALGPTLVMLHSNFQLGSVNGRIALFSMVLVAFSGVIGKYVYRKVHHGLYGKKATFNDLRTESDLLTKKLGQLLELVPETKSRLISLEERAVEMPSGLIRSLVHLISMRIRSTLVYQKIIRELSGELDNKTKANRWSPRKLKAHKRTVKVLIRAHRRALVRVTEYHFFERIFSIWHVLHLPLFIMMVITGFIHVYAVHVY